MSISHYAVVVEKYAETHYIAKFRRKHKNAWEVTWDSVVELFRRIETVIGKTNMVEVIHSSADVKICKAEFRIAGPGKSKHASGNRCIIAIHQSNAVVRVLLVYTKGDIDQHNETAAWKEIIKGQYPEYREIL